MKLPAIVGVKSFHLGDRINVLLSPTEHFVLERMWSEEAHMKLKSSVNFGSLFLFRIFFGSNLGEGLATGASSQSLSSAESPMRCLSSGATL